MTAVKNWKIWMSLSLVLFLSTMTLSVLSAHHFEDQQPQGKITVLTVAEVKDSLSKLRLDGAHLAGITVEEYLGLVSETLDGSKKAPRHLLEPEDWITIGFASLMVERFSEAEVAFSNALRHSPNDYEALRGHAAAKLLLEVEQTAISQLR